MKTVADQFAEMLAAPDGLLPSHAVLTPPHADVDRLAALSETDQTEDLKKIDVPTLIMQGDDDQIVPFADAGLLQSKPAKGATLKVYRGAPHGMCTTLKDEVNADRLAFIERKEARRAAGFAPASR
jgi:pimeloyl-ACP methyl ester carboxylesterase